MRRKLRLLDSVREYELLALPVVCEGRLDELEGYAINHGYSWCKDSSLFGGYFVHLNGNCLFVT